MFKLERQHLELYGMIRDRGIGRICNDLEREEEALLTPEEWKEFCKAYHEWNGDPETFEERTSYHMYDFMVVGFVDHILIESYKDK